MKSKDSLEAIKRIIDNTYNRFGRSLSVNTSKPFNPDNPELGYCYKFVDPTGKLAQYKIVVSQVGDEEADFRVLMHEYGHIYLAHLEGIHEELDQKIATIIEEERDVLIEQLNETCGIDFAEQLINRVIDDPVLNHSLHNIAMDMEVNSTVLDLEDIELMERNITAKLPKHQEELLKWKRDHCTDEKQKEEIDKVLKRMENEMKIKFIHPFRYHLDENTTFPDDLDYGGYLLLIVKHLDQFIKMMVSIKKGGNGDTSGITAQDVRDALQQGQGGQQGGDQQGEGQGQGQGSSGTGQGGQRADQQAGSMDYSRGLDNLLEEMGMKDIDNNGNGQQGQQQSQGGQPGQGRGQGQDGGGQDGHSSLDGENSPYKGIREGGAADTLGKDGKQPGGSHKDHMTTERQDADRKREQGLITGGMGGLGCGSSGGPDGVRQVDQMVDEVEMALQEVLQNYSSKIVEITTKKDMMYLWNRGINRNKIIVPSYKRKYDIKTNPTITFLIDISGSMDTRLVDRILKTISSGMRRLGRGLKYNIITWSTCMGEELKNLDARKPVPRIHCGGGTEMAGGMRYFKENYGKDSILVLISDFEDYMQEWHKVEETMDGYTMYGFNYGHEQKVDFKWKNFKVRNFKSHRNEYRW